MRVVDLIEQKRDGKEIAAADIKEFVDAVVRKEVPEYQTAAFLMAVYFKGMLPKELVAYTKAMLYSGDTLALKSLANKYKVDKHSTGGVGDKVSLTLAPMVAACGPVIPMISGRGLGHTGGTLDKLESVPGFRVDLSESEIEAGIDKAGYVITGQTGSLVPADKIFYALRDVTGTVPSIPLIAASIMSKKLSVGLNGLVLDVKVGSGAFMKTQEAAVELADTMISIGRAMDCDVRACITSMDQPLGVAVGNANEFIEAVEMLKGNAPKDYAHICYTLGTEMLAMAKKISNDDAREELERAIKSGRALEQLRRNIAAQGGDARVVDDYSLLKIADNTVGVCAPRDGYISAFNCEQVGKAGCILGAGRAVAGAPVDHSVGLEVLHKIGDKVRAGDTLFTVYYKDEKKCEEACHMLLEAVSFSDSQPKPNELVRDIRR
ncbi:MAG: thymidine phosphorylase [Proteobacteria bacterium]|nr:thymidine phosphorylase [Pseudomonadota bacterium]